MGSFSDYLENELLDHVFKTGAFAQPGNIYISLSTADILDDASGNAEPAVAAGYIRKVCNAWDVAAAGATENTGAVTFNVSTGAWAAGAALTHFGIWDAEAAGNLLGHGTLTDARTVGAGGITLSFAAGELDVTLD